MSVRIIVKIEDKNETECTVKLSSDKRAEKTATQTEKNCAANVYNAISKALKELN